MHDDTASAPLPGMVCTAVQERVQVVEQVQMARDTYRLRLHCPRIARQILPGQFFMVRAAGTNDPLLGRPFALYDTYEDEAGAPVGVDFGYLVIGKLTRLMTAWKPGDAVELWGPLGNGFPRPPARHLMLVAGGIGQTPFLAVAKESLGLKRYGHPARKPARRPDRLTLCYGARSAEYLAGLDDFALEGLDVRLSTDDGSRGHHGFVTDLLAEEIAGAVGNPAATGDCGDRPASHVRPDAIFCCGPEPMMHAVADIAAAADIPCWLSLETPMACGFGACFSCVVRVRLEDGQWDYRRACVEGPVFRAERLLL